MSRKGYQEGGTPYGGPHQEIEAAFQSMKHPLVRAAFGFSRSEAARWVILTFGLGAGIAAFFGKL